MAKDVAASAQHEMISAAAENESAGHTMHPDAQWFGEAGLGLFLHWGINAVEGKVDLSWGMIKDTLWDLRYMGTNKMKPVDYYAQAERFDPEAYDPDLWMAAAADAGVKYVVLTTKHHDGYAMWPSKYGNLSTRTHMHGRDLLRPYVEACRRYGLKVGFYYSPPDWYFMREYRSFGFRGYDPEKDKLKPMCFEMGLIPEYKGPLDMNWEPCTLKTPDREMLLKYNEYLRGQITELLTEYGKIDVIWFDGAPGYGIGTDETDIPLPISIEEIRQLQPGIAINPRLHGKGDFVTPECSFPSERPEGWWEGCFIWNDGSWGYSSNEGYKPVTWFLNLLAKHRAWGGNLLINCAPRPDGRMPENYYRRLEGVARWMKIHREAVFDVESDLWGEKTNVPATRRGNVWYLFLTEQRNFAIVYGQNKPPKSATMMYDGSSVVYKLNDKGDMIFVLGMPQLAQDMGVIRVEW